MRAFDYKRHMKNVHGQPKSKKDRSASREKSAHCRTCSKRIMRNWAKHRRVCHGDKKPK